MTDTARLIIEVTVGLIPGTPDHQYTRRWVVTSEEWEDARLRDEELIEEQRPTHALNATMLLCERAASADEYARLLRNPDRFNWTRTEWIWL